MALTSIHVQYNRYTVTESNTSIKEQKIWTQRGADDKQAAAAAHLQSAAHDARLRSKVFIRHFDLHDLHEKDLNGNENQRKRYKMKRFLVSGECSRRHFEPDEACRWTFPSHTPPPRWLAVWWQKEKAADWRGQTGQRKQNALLVQFLSGRGTM